MTARPIPTAAAVAAILLLASAPAGAEVAQKQGVRVAVSAKLAPAKLSRSGGTPVAVSFAGRISSSALAGPPQLQRISIALNAHGHLLANGLPRCRLGHIVPSTDSEALAACRSSLVGEGSFSADVKLPEQSPFPSQGKVLAFNGVYRGAPAIFAHIYGTRPVPTSYTLPFQIQDAKGTYGTVLEASLPQVTGEWGFVTGISMRLDRSFVSHGRQESYLSAVCPAPKGFGGATFPLARTTFAFAGSLSISQVLERSCKVAGR